VFALIAFALPRGGWPTSRTAVIHSAEAAPILALMNHFGALTRRVVTDSPMYAFRAGLTVVGIGHRAGDAELRHLLGLTQAKALVTMAEHRGRPSGELFAELCAEGLPLAHHVVIDEQAADDPLVDGELTAPRLSDADLSRRAYGPDDVFLLNSTSGTTGLPKCVIHTQNRWMYFHRLAVDAGEMRPGDVFLSALPAPYGFGIWTQHVTPAMLGAPTVVHERFDADAVLESMERERVSVLACVSTQFLMMLKSPTIETRDLSALPDQNRNHTGSDECFREPSHRGQ